MKNVEGDRPADRQETSTLAGEAYSRLREDIVDGLLPPGQPLRLEALRARYGYSFSPLREALNRLRSERLVELSALRGFRTAALSLDEMWDSIETRILIEGQALDLSIRKGGVDWESSVVGAFHALRRATEQTGPSAKETAFDDIERRHRDFHFALIGESRSRWLDEFAAQLYAQTERYRRPFLKSPYGGPDDYRDVVAEHKALMDAAVSHDAARARELLAEHYRHTGRTIEAKLRNAGAEAAVRAQPKPGNGRTGRKPRLARAV